MAEETVGIGDALGLQTNASTGYTGAPLTRAVQMGIQTQMKQDALAAKQAAEQEKLAKELNKYITPPPTQRVSPRWQKANEEVATGGFYRMFQNQNNRYEFGVQKIKTELEAKTIAEQDAYENAVLSRKTLLPKEIRDGVVNDDDGKLKKVDYNWHDYVSPVPVRYTKADGTASEKLSFHANREVPSINFADYNSDIIKARLGGQPKTEIGMVFQNTLGTKKELTDKDLREIASIVIDQDDVAFDNLKGQYEKEGKKYLQQYLAKGKEYEEAKDLALKDVEYDLLKQVYKPVFGTASAKKGGMEFNFGGGANPNVDPYDPNSPNAFEVVVNPKTGAKGKVVTGPQHSIKSVKVQGIKPSGILDIETNEPIDGNQVQEFEVGGAVAAPFATRDITLQKGDVIKKGAMINQKVLRVVKPEFIEYKPAFYGRAKYKFGDAVQESSVIIPSLGIANGVVSSQSTPDQESTGKSIKFAEQEAATMNKKVQSRIKKASAPKAGAAKEGVVAGKKDDKL